MTVTSSTAFDPNVYLQARTRWHPIEYAFWAATLLPFLVFPNHLVLASQIAITALFALSLDLILGYAGIVSLGHAAFFGLGAYAAGLIAKHGWGEPVTGLVAAMRSEEHTSELQSRRDLVCRLLLEKKKLAREASHA